MIEHSPAATSRRYLSGFGNEHESEAIPGALPVGRNSPQQAPLGLYTEQISGTAFTVPRASNRRTWVYRIRPSAAHPRFHRIDNGLLRSAPFDEVEPDPNRMRWDPLPDPPAGTDFVDGLFTMGGNGDTRTHHGIGIHLYAADRSMTDRCLVDADGELLLVPQGVGCCCTPSWDGSTSRPERSRWSPAGSASGSSCPMGSPAATSARTTGPR